jgi:hypothetical protein
MKNIKNLDSISKPKNPRPIAKVTKSIIVFNVDGLTRGKKVRQKPAFVVPFKANRTGAGRFVFLQKLRLKNQVPIMVAVVALFLAFGGGVWATLSTNKSVAYNSQPEVLGDSTTVPAGSMVIPNAEVPPANPADVSNDELFNTPIQELQNYLANVSQPDIIANRTAALTKFLNDMGSPFASAAATIANQSHWQLILEISFAESTLGKNCKDNNCSNIGVGPNSPLWHQYASYQDWVVSFNRLLDKRYNNWTLDQMCGVYVKPCNPHWLMATKEISADLEDRGIQ